MRLAVIPARGGSKRIPRKNIKVFGGKPIIAWSIEAALLSGCFDRVLVSTDDPEITQVALAYGADVPFERPRELSDDHTGTIPVIAHAIEWQANHGGPPNLVCCIYATAPFIQITDLQSGLELLQSSDADYVFGATSYAFPVQRAIRISQDRRVEMFQPSEFNTRSQDLDEAWHDAGQFYWGRAAAWLANKPLFTQKSIAMPIPRHRVQDIDSREDWERAEWLFRAFKNYTNRV